MVPALRIRRDKPVNERKVNTQFGQQFDSARLHFKFRFALKAEGKRQEAERKTLV